MRKVVIGVMGSGANATSIDCNHAYHLGQLIAQQGWILLTGGRNVGVMDAASQGARQAGGLTIGILPDESDRHLSEAIDIPIFTGMGSARNNINVLSSTIVIACGMGAGTASEIALALKAEKFVILIGQSEISRAFFQQLAAQRVFFAETPQEAIALCQQILTT
jgi:hypothetical protein